MPKFSVKRPFLILVGVIIVLVLGGVSYSKMTTDLLPNMNMPYMMVITTYVGAAPEKVEKDITEPMESAVGTVNGVKKVTSNSAENSSMVMLQFQDDTNMDAAMVKVSSAVNQLELPDTAGQPMIMEISMDMMSTVMASVDYEGKDRVELASSTKKNCSVKCMGTGCTGIVILRKAPTPMRAVNSPPSVRSLMFHCFINMLCPSKPSWLPVCRSIRRSQQASPA